MTHAKNSAKPALPGALGHRPACNAWKDQAEPAGSCRLFAFPLYLPYEPDSLSCWEIVISRSQALLSSIGLAESLESLPQEEKSARAWHGRQTSSSVSYGIVGHLRLVAFVESTCCSFDKACPGMLMISAPAYSWTWGPELGLEIAVRCPESVFLLQLLWIPAGLCLDLARTSHKVCSCCLQACKVEWCSCNSQITIRPV